MSDQFIGQIQSFGFNFAPKGWMFCNGQLMSIAQNTALFSLLGTTYGGDGISTFALPNLQGRVPLGFGTGPGLSTYELGEVVGSETVTLTSNQMPAHSHALSGSTAGAGSGDPTNNALSGEIWSNSPPNAVSNPASIRSAGGNQPHSNMQPTLAINWCIATEGIYPSRP